MAGFFDDDDLFNDPGWAGPAARVGIDQSTGDGTLQQITDAYRAQLGRDPDQRELASEVENFGKYGGEGLGATLAQRASSNGRPDPPGMHLFGGGAPAQSGGYNPGQFASPAPINPFTETFTAPTAQQARETPGFKFNFDNAMQAIDRTGLAKGTYGTNQRFKALQEQAVGLSDQTYGNTYDRAFNEYLTKGNIFNQNEANRYNSQRSNNLDQFGMFDSGRNFDLRQNDQSFNQNRATQGDAWNRGLDVWNINRTGQQDDFNNTVTLEDLRQRYRPRPA